MTTEDEQEHVEVLLDMLAGIALPGLIGKAGLFIDHAHIAKEAYDIAEAMIVERTKRLEYERTSSN